MPEEMPDAAAVIEDLVIAPQARALQAAELVIIQHAQAKIRANREERIGGIVLVEIDLIPGVETMTACAAPDRELAISKRAHVRSHPLRFTDDVLTAHSASDAAADGERGTRRPRQSGRVFQMREHATTVAVRLVEVALS
jgi:hypothetical protein